MISAPLGPNESLRLAALQRYGVLESHAEQAFDALTQAAAYICDVPISLVSLVDAKRQWFKSATGLPGVTETPRAIAFCSHAILGEGLFEVPDAGKDTRFSDNPLVTSDPHIRFYAGVPLIDSDRFALGTLCVIDRKPRRLTRRQRDVLVELGKAAIRLFEAQRDNSLALCEAEEAHRQEQAARVRTQMAHAELKAVAARLEASNGLLKLAEQLAHIGHWRFDRTSGKGFWSEEVYRIHGLDPRKPPPGGVEASIALYHPEDRAKLAGMVHRAMETGETYSDELRVVRPDGAVRDVTFSGQPERDPDGAIVGLIGILQDITERKAVERERMTLQERMLLATRAGRVGVWEYLPHKNHIICDEGMYRLYGFDPKSGELPYERWTDAVHPEDSARLEAELAAAVAAARSYDVEYRVIWPSGEIRHLRAQGAPIDTAGSFRLVGTNWDVTEARSLAEQLRQEKERLQAANSMLLMADELAHIGHWSVKVARGGGPPRDIYWSDEVYRIHGMDPAQGPLTGQAAIERYHPEDRARITALVTRALATGASYSCELRLVRRDGAIRDISTSGRPEFGPGGTLVGLFGVFQDITDRKNAERDQARLNERVVLANQAARVGIWEWLIPENRFLGDDAMHYLTGLEAAREAAGQELPWTAWVEAIHPDDRERILADCAAVVAERRPYQNEYRVVWPNGEIRHIRAKGAAIYDADGTPLRMVGTNWDITEKRLLAEQLFQEKERLQITLASIGDAVVATDEAARVTFMNPVAETLLGWTLAEAVGRPVKAIFRLVCDDTGKPVDCPVERCLAAGAVIKLEDGISLIGRTGQRYAVQDTAAPVRRQNGEIVGAVLVFQDVSRARELQRALSFSANHDALTGLYNRTKFESECRTALELARRSNATHALCFIDLDRFKLVNDSAGHAAGDMLLREIAAAAQRVLRSTDTIARLGGDEFGLLLRECPLEKAHEICSKLVETISAIRLPWEGGVYDVGASVGIAMVSGEAGSIGELMSQADVACYASKHAGRNRVSIYHKSQSEAGAQHREILQAAGLRNAIETNRFVLYAQEIVPTANRTTSTPHLELLLRMTGEDGEIIPPGAFIPAAERFGLMAAIDRWVIQEALIELGPSIAARPGLGIAINLSGNSLSDPELLWELLTLVEASPLEPSRIQFEITETAIMSHLAVASRLVSALREAGCTVALDDFGSGLSSFSYLKNFATDVIKIDGCFVRNMDANPTDLAIVESINALAHRLGAKTVAESVETNEVFQKLQSIGVDYAQGYAISRPAPLKTKLRDLEMLQGFAGKVVNLR